MAMFGFNQDKLIESLFALPQAKELRQGKFALTLTEANQPDLSICLSISAPEHHTPPVQLPPPELDR